MHFHSAPVENELKTSGLQHSKRKEKNSKFKIHLKFYKFEIWVDYKMESPGV